MRKSTLLLICVSLAIGAAGTALAEDKPQTLKIGVVDVKKIFTDYNKQRDEHVELEKQKKEIEDDLDKKGEKIKKLQQKMDVLKGEKKLKVKAEFDEKKKEFMAFFNFNQKALERKQRDLWITMYNEIHEEIKRHGEKEGYDLILRSDAAQIRGKSFEEVQLRVDLKKILYNSPKVDLTKEITNILNDKYNRLKESKEKRP